MAKFEVELKKSALKKLRSFPKSSQDLILDSISNFLTVRPYFADGKHIKKLTEGYRLRVSSYRVFYYIDGDIVVVASVVRRTSTTY